ncbi:DNA primase [Mycoplasma sp. CSL7503-lung]|uniref:DNA primase n=1 Tax=Mycoplasma sp. CSL7503-lung TaxID=536372 RepID=UPI0021D26B66|nr:DNA primase [Mycoplasma sp. CSL7503-lung]MCU4706832.1 DNA primase [Mycoplasma sp. CSL7503-lung]
MATIPTEIVNEIISNSNIVNVVSNFLTLKRKGNNYSALCPFHSDSNPSFSVSPQKNIYKCFSCGESGNSLTFVMKKTGKNFVEALEFLAEMIGYNYDFSNYKFNPLSTFSNEELNLLELLDAANTFLKTQLLKFESAQKFLNDRQVNNFDILNTFDLGYSRESDLVDYLTNKLNYSEKEMIDAGLLNSDLYNFFKNRVTFAIRDNNGKVVGFSGRTLDPNIKSKYINSPETKLFKKSKILYNFHNAKEFIKAKKEIIIVEGFFDVIALYKSDIKNVVALMGTALSESHISNIKNYKIKLFLDNDQAGINASLKSILSLYKHGVHDIDIIVNTYNKDPDEIFKQYGKNKITELLDNTKNSLDFIYEHFIHKNRLIDNRDFSSLQNFENDIIEFLEYLPEKFSNYIINNFNKSYDYKIEVKKNNIEHEPKDNIHYENTITLDENDLIPNYEPIEFNEQNLDSKNYYNNNFNNTYINNNSINLLSKTINNNIQIKFLIYMLENKYINDKIDQSDNRFFFLKHELYRNIYTKIQQMHKQSDNSEDFLDSLEDDFEISNNLKNIISIKKEEVLNDLKNIFSQLIYLENKNSNIDQISINSFFDDYSKRIKNELNLNGEEWEISLDPLIRAFTNEFILKNKNNMANIDISQIDLIRAYNSRNVKTTINKKKPKGE